jgi:hypothetical protein
MRAVFHLSNGEKNYSLYLHYKCTFLNKTLTADWESAVEKLCPELLVYV